MAKRPKVELLKIKDLGDLQGYDDEFARLRES
jgi:hypothetical protein